MGERKSLMGTTYQLSKVLKLQQIDGSESEIATVHEINRQGVVKEILVHCFFMSKFGLIDHDLKVGKAHSQYFTATADQQAAHCSPGQIFYRSRKIQDFLSASDELHVEVDNLFGRTDAIHKKFNTADSRAEENGLRLALRAACISSASAAKSARFNRAMEMYPYVSTAFGAYKSFGVQAMRSAAARQRSLMRRRDPEDVRARETTISILNTYAECLQTADDSLETVQGLFPEDIWRDYQSLR
jgi:hypothetical protein